MTLTEKQLDDLCGAPEHQLRCQECGRTTRRYYSPALARESLFEHIRAAHETGARMEPEEKGGLR